MTQSKQSKKHRRSRCLRVLRTTDVSVVMHIAPLPAAQPRHVRRMPTLTTRGACKDDQFGDTIVVENGSFVQYAPRARFWNFVQIKVEMYAARPVVALTLEGFREGDGGVVLRKEVPTTDVSVICVNGQDVLMVEGASNGNIRLRLGADFRIGSGDMFSEGVKIAKK